MNSLTPNPPQEPDVITGRFSGASWFETIKNTFNILVAGSGGIGSWTTLILSRFYPRNLSVTDPDRFERINMSGQFCFMQDVGKLKSHALQDNVYRFSGDWISTYSDRIEEIDYLNDYNILICGFDNMQARKAAFRRFKETSSLRFFIDGRLSFSRFQIYCINKDNSALMKKYEEEALFDDSEAEETVCTMKQTSFLADMIGSMIANYVANYAANISEESGIEHSVPYFTEYNSVLAELTTVL